eukprot:UN18823
MGCEIIEEAKRKAIKSFLTERDSLRTDKNFFYVSVFPSLKPNYPT